MVVSRDEIDRIRRAIVVLAGGGFQSVDLASILDASLDLADAAIEFDTAVQRLSVVDEITEEWHADFFDGRSHVQNARAALDRALMRVAAWPIP